MRHIKLFEAYSEEVYNRVLDLYNGKGEDHMTPDEVAYLKSGGDTDIPDSFREVEILNSPFILCVGEDIWKYYTDVLKINPDGDKNYEKDNLKINFKCFVISGYEPIKVTNKNRETLDNIRSKSEVYTSEDFEYFQQYDTGLVLWSFDENFPEDKENWEDFIKLGGLSGAWEDLGGGMRAALNMEEDPPGKDYRYTFQEMNIDLNGEKLTPENIKREIDSLVSSGELTGWKNNIDITEDKDTQFPIYSRDLFDLIY